MPKRRVLSGAVLGALVLSIVHAPPAASLPNPARVVPNHVVVNRQPGDQAEDTIDVDPRNPARQIVVGHAPLDSPDGEPMDTFYSHDDGATWTKVSLDAAVDGFRDAKSRFDPFGVWDEIGNFYATYIVLHPKDDVKDGAGRVVTAAGSLSTVVVVKSTDGGRTYKKVVELNRAAPEVPEADGAPTNDRVTIIAGRDPTKAAQQNVYVAWTLTKQFIHPDGTKDDDRTIALSRSLDGGKTWSPLEQINDQPAVGPNEFALAVDLAIGPNGELYAVWFDADSDRVFFDRYNAVGKTWSVDRAIGEKPIEHPTKPRAIPARGTTTGPVIDVDRSGGAFSGTIYVVYASEGFEAGSRLPLDIDLSLLLSPDGGVTWGLRPNELLRYRVNDDTLEEATSTIAVMPWMEVDQKSGMVGVSWYDSRGGAEPSEGPAPTQLAQFATIVVPKKDNAGKTVVEVLPNVRISAYSDRAALAHPSPTRQDYLEYNGLAFHDCVLYPVWADNSPRLDKQPPADDLDYHTTQVSVVGMFAPADVKRTTCRERKFDTNHDGTPDIVLADADDDGFLEWTPGCNKVWPGVLRFRANDRLTFDGNAIVSADEIVVDQGAILSHRDGALNTIDLIAAKRGIRSHGRLDMSVKDEIRITAKRGDLQLSGNTFLRAVDKVALTARTDRVLLTPPAQQGFAVFANNAVTMSAKGANGSIDIARAHVGSRAVTLDAKAGEVVVAAGKRILVSDGALVTTDKARTSLKSASDVALTATGRIHIDGNAAVDSGRSLTFSTSRAEDDLCLTAGATIEGTKIYTGNVRGFARRQNSTVNGPVPGKPIDQGACP